MKHYPLLSFPSKAISKRSKKSSSGGDKFKTPSPAMQDIRLSPKFQELHDALQAKRIEVQESTDGIDPEQVLVFETIGSVEDFSKAVSNIEGFEWLGEFDLNDIIPDDNFYEVDKKEKKLDKTLNGRLYFIFTNTSAMRQLLSYWNLWKEDPNFDCKRDPHRGKGKIKDVFKKLKDIRRWDVEDRFSESNILDIWRENIRYDPTQNIRFEIELWYRANETQRNNSFTSVTKLVKDLGGRIITTSHIREIRYHAILAELPGSQIDKVINNRNIELVKSDNIMFFKPSGQIIIDSSYTEQELTSHHGFSKTSYPSGAPVVAVFDGLPMTGHEALKNRLIIDDPDNIESFYQVEDRKHGTGMCSLITQGDLEANNRPLSTLVYVRPIMRPDSFTKYEFVPDDSLLPDTILRATKRMFEGDGDEPPTAPFVKIINFSIGDPARLYYTSISPLAKLLDWLSYKYKVLFVISSGNHIKELNVSQTRSEFGQLDIREREKIFFDDFLNNSRNSRIMSPAESINNLTVGALHYDYSQISPNDERFNPYEQLFPGTYTAIGGGHRKSIKPDLVYHGGRLMYDYSLYDNTVMQPTKYKSSPGQKVAAPDSTRNKCIYEVGTSNAAALVTRAGHHCHEFLEQFEKDNNSFIPDNYRSVVIKAMIIHGCSWEGLSKVAETQLNGMGKVEIKKLNTKFFGYGYPDLDKVKECTEQRVTIVGYGELGEEEAHIYTLPLPPSLAARTIKRKLTISLAWFTPISPSTQRYRTAQLWFEAKNNLADDRQDADHNAVRRGTLQHEVFEGSKATAFMDGDSIKVKINCTKDANSFSDKIPYAVLVTLEVAESINLPIYEEVKSRISIPVITELPVSI